MDKARKKELKNQYKSKAGDIESAQELIPVPGDLQCGKPLEKK